MPRKMKKKKPPSDKKSSKGGQDIREVSKKTQFKSGDEHPTKKDPNFTHPWSVRNCLRYMMAQEISTDSDQLDAELKRLAGMRKTAPASRMGALRMMERFMKKMEPQMVGPFLDNLEGKLTQVTLTDPPVKVHIEGLTIEELAITYQETMKRK